MILFRCDSAFEIGSGHVFRSLTLAQTLRDLGQKCIFFCKDLPGNVSNRIVDAGFELIKVSVSTGQVEEIKQIQNLKPSWVVVDHYDLDLQWESEIKKFSSVFVIDDTMNRPHCCDALLDQNFRSSYENAYKGLVPSDCRLLLGPRYSLLKPELKRTSAVKTFRSSKQQVLVFFGGADPTGELLKFYKAAVSSVTQLQFKLVATSSHKFFDELKRTASVKNCEIVLSPENWIQLLEESDFYFGSSGSVTWERCYLGLPGALVVIADNQIQIAEELQKAGLQYYFGEMQDVDYNEALKRIEVLVQDRTSLQAMSEKTKQLVDRLSPELVKEIFIGG